MKMNSIFRNDVVRGQIGAAAEPRRRPALEVANVGVHGRHARVARVQHQRHAGRAEAQPVARQRRRHLGPQLAVHVGEVHARLLEQRAVGQHARPPAAAARAIPFVLAERAAVGALERGDDVVLQRAKKIAAPRRGSCAPRLPIMDAPGAAAGAPACRRRRGTWDRAWRPSRRSTAPRSDRPAARTSSPGSNRAAPSPRA